MVVGTKGPEYRTIIKRMPNTLRVGFVPGGDTEYTSIQAAINYAATQAPSATNPWTIHIYPGIYNEVVTCVSWVNLKGIGPRGSVVIYQNDAALIVTLADNVELQNFTIRLGTPAAGRALLYDGTVACTAKIRNVAFEITTPGAFAHEIIALFGAGNYIIDSCYYSIGGTGGNTGVHSATNASTIHLTNNDFSFTNINAKHLQVTIASTVTGYGNHWAGTCGMFNVTAGTLTFDNSAMICTGAWTNTGSTMTLRACAIEAPVVAGNLATVRMKNCSYRAISRSGTGNIVDESPDLKDAPWHVEKWDWMTALASMDVAVRGVPVDAGSGQVIIETLDSGAGVMAVETNTELARALGNHFTPARTPRFLTQISGHTDGAGGGASAFDPHVDMFFGLRQTLGNSVPVAAEHHAGFGWDNLDASVNKFWAISSDGVQQITLLTTPSDDAQHQLEVVVFGGVTTVGWVEFYIDGVLVATHSTRIPVNTLDWQHLIIGLGTGGGDTISVTIRPGGCQECPS